MRARNNFLLEPTLPCLPDDDRSRFADSGFLYRLGEIEIALGPGGNDIGNIFATNTIGTVDLGDGLIGPGNGPMAEAGIMAVNDITEVITSRASGSVIGGFISARNINPLDAAGNPDLTNRHGAPAASRFASRFGRPPAAMTNRGLTNYLPHASGRAEAQI